MSICVNCGNPHKRTVRSFIGRWKGQNIHEEWVECSICGGTEFTDAKPEWRCENCEAVGMFEDLLYDEFNDEDYCPHCGSRKLWEV